MKTPRFDDVSTKQARIAEQARACPDMVFTTLHHYIDRDWMRRAWNLTRKDGATGVDGVTAAEYEKELEANLLDLMNRIKSGSYRAPPVRRHYIPKPDGRQRPLGIPTLEDKVAQRAIAMVLEPIYETDFLPCSYGFRPGRSAHDALDELRAGLGKHSLRWVIDADVESCFDSIDHKHLREFLDLRIKDGVIRRMIDKWLKAGVLDKGVLQRSESGTPQGGVVSPILSNIFLHHVLDLWVKEAVQPRVGACRLVRYADDFVIAFKDRRDGERVLAVLGKRLARFGLTLHPTKTRFVDFRHSIGGAHDTRNRFEFLGFLHMWGTSQEGHPVVRRYTASTRFARAARSVWEWCRTHRHLPLDDQQRHLASVIRGHCAYYGVTGNSRRLARFRETVIRSWRYWLGRRHRTGGWIVWGRFSAILARFPLPTAKVTRSIYST
ncbi:MAG: group II intron reverse transcriptase/maturase [bacterium]|nr:group II intron reverse transcriptase/maturase [bacterium]